MTEATTEAPATEDAVVESVPVLANLADADSFSQATVPVAVSLINAYNDIATKNASKTQGVDEIAATLADSSNDPKVVALRAKRDEISEQISKLVLDEAKRLKADAGEPDLDAEKNAAEAMRGVLKALATFPDGKRVQHFLPDVVKGTGTRVNTGSTNSGPKNDLSAVRTWAKANGFPDVKDRGRMSDEILDAYNKANASK